MANLDELYRNLEGKEHEITVLYASATGRNIANLSEGERFRLAAEVGELVEEAEEAAFIEDETVEEWRVLVTRGLPQRRLVVSCLSATRLKSRF